MAQQLAAEGHSLLPDPLREKAVVADAHETPWKDLTENAPDEDLDLLADSRLPGPVPVVLDREANVVLLEDDQTLVREGNPVGVTGKMTQKQTLVPLDEESERFGERYGTGYGTGYGYGYGYGYGGRRRRSRPMVTDFCLTFCGNVNLSRVA